MMRFFVYEAFVANNEIMRSDAALTLKAVSEWPSYERGIEALSKSISPMVNREADSRKGLTFNDLLIKVCSFSLIIRSTLKMS
jgi:hypothetical protein